LRADLALPSNLDKVIAWYEAAAEEGNPSAQVGLGLHYQFGNGVSTNRYVAGALYLIAQQSSGRQSEKTTFMGPKDIARSADVEMQALAKELAKPGNLLKAISWIIAHPPPEPFNP
jgi:TPR repeat protein